MDLSASHFTVKISVLLLAGLISCTPRDSAPSVQHMTAAESSGTHNVLTESERIQGWRLLFDGQSLSGWRGYRQEDIPGKWRIDAGAIHFSAADGEGGDLITEETFSHVELAFDWKISKCGNSGLFYLVVESENYNQTYHSGPEAQILDNTCHRDAKNGPDRTAGANYALHPPTRDNTRPAGEWNQMRLVLNGPHVEHWLNGEKVVGYELRDEAWYDLVSKSKFARWPDYGLAREGRFALQDHGDPVWFRNIKIRFLLRGE